MSKAQNPKTELMVQLTYQCNLDCSHCAYGDIKNSIEVDWIQVSNFLERHNPKLIKISGGEPTLAKCYEDILRTCKAESDAKVIVFTNGLGNPRKHPHKYWVSLYGPKKIHNQITQANTFDKTMQFIKDHEVEYLNSPIFSRAQIKRLQDLSWELEIPLRITRLLPHGNARNVLRLKRTYKIIKRLRLHRKPNWVTCSLGFEPPRCWKKMCLNPFGKEVLCTAIIRGLGCPFRKKIPALLWEELFKDEPREL